MNQVVREIVSRKKSKMIVFQLTIKKLFAIVNIKYLKKNNLIN